MPYIKPPPKMEWDLYPMKNKNMHLGFYAKRAVCKIIFGTRTNLFYVYLKSEGVYYKLDKTFKKIEDAKIYLSKIYDN